MFLFLFFCCFLFVFLGGFKGQVRWPKGPPHLALNPPYLFFLFFGFWFFSLLCFLCFLIDKKPVFPLEKGIFCLFSMFLFLSPLTFFGLPLFLFPFLCLSVALFFLPSFLSFFFAFFLFLVFVSFFPYLFSLLLFHEKKTWNYSIAICFPEIFSLLVSCLAFLFQMPFSYLCFFLILSYVFSSTSMFLVSKRTNWEAQKTKKKQIATKRFFFLWTCVLQHCKSYRFFFAPFLPIFGWCSKNTIKIGISAHFWKHRIEKKCILRCYYLGQVGVIIWAKLIAS